MTITLLRIAETPEVQRHMHPDPAVALCRHGKDPGFSSDQAYVSTARTSLQFCCCGVFQSGMSVTVKCESAHTVPSLCDESTRFLPSTGEICCRGKCFLRGSRRAEELIQASKGRAAFASLPGRPGRPIASSTVARRQADRRNALAYCLPA
jgi:hypothetical protein